MVKTRWVNLGPGLDHKDPLWTYHAAGSALFRYNTGQVIYLLSIKDTKAKSPNLCYESQAPESFEKLRERNISYLKGERYKIKPFELFNRALWKIQILGTSHTKSYQQNRRHDLDGHG